MAAMAALAQNYTSLFHPGSSYQSDIPQSIPLLATTSTSGFKSDPDPFNVKEVPTKPKDSVTPKISYLNSKCMIVTYLDQDVQSLLEDHFSRSLTSNNSPATPGSNLENKAQSKPSGSASFPASFWKPPARSRAQDRPKPYDKSRVHKAKTVNGVVSKKPEKSINLSPTKKKPVSAAVQYPTNKCSEEITQQAYTTPDYSFWFGNASNPASGSYWPSMYPQCSSFDTISRPTCQSGLIGTHTGQTSNKPAANSYHSPGKIADAAYNSHGFGTFDNFVGQGFYSGTGGTGSQVQPGATYEAFLGLASNVMAGANVGGFSSPNGSSVQSGHLSKFLSPNGTSYFGSSAGNHQTDAAGAKNLAEWGSLSAGFNSANQSRHPTSHLGQHQFSLGTNGSTGLAAAAAAAQVAAARAHYPFTGFDTSSTSNLDAAKDLYWF